jgi:phosphatidylglycerol---prolipoprotein diacylglyceryl transferase
VSGPQIPYIKLQEIPLPLGLPSPLDSIKPFGILVATGVYIGSVLAMRRAKQRGLDQEKMSTFILYVVGIGFIGAHVFDAIFYTPEKILQDPLYLFKLYAGLSSYGGFLGSIIGVYVYKWVKKDNNVFAYVDTICSAFPLAWVFGRAGCASVHDHPGRETSHWLGMQYNHPGVHQKGTWGLLYDPSQTVGRFDLGFIEMVLTIPLATAFMILWRQKPRASGFYAGWQCILYAPVRFVLDFFRVEEGGGLDADPRFLGLTPAQYACFGLAAIGVYVLRLSKQYPAPATWADQARLIEEEEEALLLAEKEERKALEAKRKKKKASKAPTEKAKAATEEAKAPTEKAKGPTEKAKAPTEKATQSDDDSRGSEESESAESGPPDAPSDPPSEPPEESK